MNLSLFKIYLKVTLIKAYEGIFCLKNQEDSESEHPAKTWVLPTWVKASNYCAHTRMLTYTYSLIFLSKSEDTTCKPLYTPIFLPSNKTRFMKVFLSNFMSNKSPRWGCQDLLQILQTQMLCFVLCCATKRSTGRLVNNVECVLRMP